MNKISYLTISVILVLAFSCCRSSKSNNKREQHPPFKITKAFYNTWVGGQPGVKGYSVQFEIDNSDIMLDSVFFRNMSAKLERDHTTSKNLFIATFILPNRLKNYILHRDPKKEFGNELPDILEKIPFQLNSNEAVISYLVDNTTVYYKVTNVVELKKSQKF
ncbi:hypothetical protein [Lutibacter sp.]|uniref:hypothetical protein n=1 Tax=Lutibacter sp. TaxID=1925666 RepID=UPI0034A08607